MKTTVSLALIILLSAIGIGRADPLDEWTLRLQSPPVAVVELTEVVFGNGQFVATGSGDTNLVSETSSDGVNWVTHQSGPPGPSFTYGNGLFVSMSLDGRPATSTDGVTWVSQPTPGWGIVGAVSGIGYGNGLFVALVNAVTSNIVTSTDGTNWIQRQSPATTGLGSIAYGNGQFVAVGSTNVVTSPDGVNWTLRNPAIPYESYESFAAIAYGNGQFVAVAFGNQTAFGNYPDVFTSSNGVSWTSHQSGANGLGAIAFGNGQFVAIGGGDNILSSTDGVTWNQTPANGWDLSRVAFGNDQFVAVGGSAILTSTDGADWTVRQSGCQGQVGSVSYINGQFVALSDCGTIFISDDGENWVTRQTGTQNPLSSLSAIAYGNGQYVAATVSNIVTSTDGTNWVQHPAAATVSNIVTTDGTNRVQHPATNQFRLQQIIYGDGEFFGWGWPSKPAREGADVTSGLLSSADGTNWTLSKALYVTNQVFYYGIVYGSGQFVAVGGAAGIFGGSAADIETSTDGIHWTTQQSPTTNCLTSVTYGNGQFVAVGYHFSDDTGGQSGGIITSVDGTNWAVRLSLSSPGTVAYGNGQFVATGGNGALFTSGDGVNWAQRQLAIPWWWRYGPGLAYGNGHFLFSGSAATSADLWETAVAGIWESGSIITLAAIRDAQTGLQRVSLEGPTGLNYAIQSSPDLISWQTITNFTSAQPTSVFLNAPPAAPAHMFYRAYSQ